MTVRERKHRYQLKFGFTLVELLVVITIIGVLAAVGLASFRTSQIKGRDAARKSDLKEIKNALEFYFNDNGKYPDAPLPFGSEFTDGTTVFFRVMPQDPFGFSYAYRVVPSSANQKFQLYAHLENSQDPSCLAGSSGNPDCISPLGIPAGVSCGSAVCNFSITSSNTTPTE